MASLATAKVGLISKSEARRAASLLFAKLDRDGRGRLERSATRGRLPKSDFDARKGSDGRVSEGAYVQAVEIAFTVADLNRDALVSCEEARTETGRSLMRMIR